jgi:hypothetical protein
MRVACMRLLDRLKAPGRNAHSIGSAHSADITPHITRPPARLRILTTCVSRVACMRLFGGDATSRPRGARHPHDLRLPPTPRESHHAPLARHYWFSPAREVARQHFIFVIRQKPPNARHHPRPYSTSMRDSVAGRRVHAVVRPTQGGRLKPLRAQPSTFSRRYHTLETPNPTSLRVVHFKAVRMPKGF